MKKYIVVFLILFSSFLIAEEKEYDSDEWKEHYKDSYYIEENEQTLINLVEEIEEVEEKEESNKEKPQTNYFTKMYIEGILKLKWKNPHSKNQAYDGKINSYILANYYEAFLGFNSVSPQFNTLAFRFSPFLMHISKKRLFPVLSLYLGNFNTPQVFRNVSHPIINSLTTTSNREFFPPLKSIKILKRQNNTGIALEVSLPFFNYYSFWKNTAKGNIFNTYISYKNENLPFSKVNIAFVSSIQELKQAKPNLYLQIYGLDFNFASKFFYANSLSLLTVLPAKTPSFSSFALKNEMGVKSKIVSFHTGISYKGAYYLGNQNLKELLQRKTCLSFYIQGKLKHKVFHLASMYHLLKDYKINKIHHSYGIFYSLGNSFISYKNELFYSHNVYKLKLALNIMPNLSHFKLFNISSFLYLQDRKINSKCIKKYEIASKANFNITKDFALNFIFGLMQENLKEKIFFASSTFNFSFNQEKAKEKGTIKLKYTSKNHSIEVSLRLKIEY
ncbi:MAG: hypothetical protein ACTTKH_03280 [Treponema sp.]